MIRTTTGKNLIEPELAEERAAILKALGNPVRLRIVACLAAGGEQTVGTLCRTLGLHTRRVFELFARIWGAFRADFLGAPAAAPRIWAT